MANKHQKAITPCWIFVLVLSLNTLNHGRVQGEKVFDKSIFVPRPRGTVKSIEVLEDGDIVDCVLFHKQIAFDHALLKDLQTNFSDPYQPTNDEEILDVYQDWHKYGECPKGTVPIRRAKRNEISKKQLPRNLKVEIQEYARVILPFGTYLGAVAYMNIWNPKVEPGEYSSAQMWLQSGSSASETLASVEGGWINYPKLYGDSQTRLFIHYTNDNFKTGCFNTLCPGFIQTDHRYSLGMPLHPTSKYNGSQYAIPLAIFKDPKKGDWYFKVGKLIVGYWPEKVVWRLSKGVESVEWGGEVLNLRPQDHHTSSEMGSGHFATEGQHKSAYMRNLQVFDKDYIVQPASDLITITYHSTCYDVLIGEKGTTYKTHFYYGGPGLSQQCPR